MKKILLATLAVAGLLFGSCTREQVSSVDPLDGGKSYKATFSIGLADNPTTKTIGDGTTVDALYAAVYGLENGAYTLVETQSSLDGSIQIQDKTADFSCKLVKNSAYKIVFFAEVKGVYTLNFEANSASFEVPIEAPANDETRDAFFYVYDIEKVESTIQEDVTLKRPFGQVNLLAKKGDFTPYTSSLEIIGMPTVLDFLTGELSGGEESYFFYDADCPTEDAFGNYAEDYFYVGMNYALADTDGVYDIYFAVQATEGEPVERSLTQVPIKRNVRTNIVGNLFAPEDVDATYTIIIGNDFDGDTDPINSDAIETTIIVPDPATGGAIGADPDHAIVLPTDGTAAPTVQIVPQATEDGVTGRYLFTSADEEVATVAADNPDDEGLGTSATITGVSDGMTYINVHPVGLTKVDYTAADIKVWVKVGSGEKQISDFSFLAEPEELKVGESGTIRVTTVPEDCDVEFGFDKEGIIEVVETEDGWAFNALAVGEVSLFVTVSKEGYESRTESQTINVLSNEKLTQVLLWGWDDDGDGEIDGEGVDSYSFDYMDWLPPFIFGAKTAVTYEVVANNEISVDAITVNNNDGYLDLGPRELAGLDITVTATAEETDEYSGATASLHVTSPLPEAPVLTIKDGWDEEINPEEGFSMSNGTEYTLYITSEPAVSIEVSSASNILDAEYSVESGPITVVELTAMGEGEATLDIHIDQDLQMGVAEVNLSIPVTITPEFMGDLQDPNLVVTYENETWYGGEEAEIEIEVGQTAVLNLSYNASDFGTSYDSGYITSYNSPETVTITGVSEGTGYLTIETYEDSEYYSSSITITIIVNAATANHGSGTFEDPYDVEGVVAYIDSDDYDATKDVVVKGFVRRYANDNTTYGFSTQYGNGTFFIYDGTEGGAEFEAYRVSYIGSSTFKDGHIDVQVGDEVVLSGPVLLYTNNSGAQTYETKQNEAMLVSINGVSNYLPEPEVTVEGDAENKRINFTVGEVPNVSNLVVECLETEWASGYSGGNVTDYVEVSSYGTYTIRVQAQGNGTEYFDGAYVTKTITLQDPNTPTGHAGTDVLNNAWTGISGSNYVEKTGLVGSGSDVLYTVQAAGGNDAIQLRSKNSNSGIVSTTTGGKVTKVVVKWNSNTLTDGTRQIDIYGSNNPFTSPSQLYNVASGSGIVSLGSIVCGTSTTLEIDGDYGYIGIRSKDNALYLDEVQITWSD